ncbi:hypothetical protein LP420_38985 [Massilia sp. B-10]|nr:hypothetical protein LP420_38985 [Massilia sp. B-10]
MSKLAPKVSALMDDAELDNLVRDHYRGEAQTLTTGAEENLLKLAHLLGRPDAAERGALASLDGRLPASAQAGRGGCGRRHAGGQYPVRDRGQDRRARGSAPRLPSTCACRNRRAWSKRCCAWPTVTSKPCCP